MRFRHYGEERTSLYRTLRRIEEATGVRREMVGEYLRKLRVVVRLPGRAIFSSGEEFDKRLRELSGTDRS